MVNGRDVMRLKVPQRLVDARRERLLKFIELRRKTVGVECLVADAATLYLSSFEWSWHEWWSNVRIYVPRRLDWLVRLVDRDYAALCRQVDAALPDDFTKEDVEDACDDE